MRQISISELSSLRWSFYQDVIRYASQGFDSIGIWRQKIEDVDIAEAADFLFEMQMNVSSVHWAGGFTGGEGRSHVESIDDAIEAIQLTSRLSGDCLIVHPGCRNGHTFSHARRLFAMALRTLVPVARDFGVKLAIEPMPCRTAAAWTFFDRLESSLDLISDYSNEHLGLVLDLYHVGLNPDVFDDLYQFIDNIALVQLADRQIEFSAVEKRMLLGTGQVPINIWLQRLQNLGYTGNYEVELHGAGMNELPYAEMLGLTADFFQHQRIEEILSDTATDSATAQLRRTSNQ